MSSFCNVNFNESLTDDIVSFEQLGPDQLASSEAYLSSAGAEFRKLEGWGLGGGGGPSVVLYDN